MSEVEVKRQMSTSDIAAVTALLDETSAADGRPALSDHLRLDLESGGGAGFAGFTIANLAARFPTRMHRSLAATSRLPWRSLFIRTGATSCQKSALN